jgi:hypothetical protein
MYRVTQLDAYNYYILGNVNELFPKLKEKTLQRIHES